MLLVGGQRTGPTEAVVRLLGRIRAGLPLLGPLGLAEVASEILPLDTFPPPLDPLVDDVPLLSPPPPFIRTGSGLRVLTRV